ncbi:MAG TPA: energy transducer TonB [Thermoanaerobaculia bacterium]|nr:energy transducer TonB [Thermoanaerobaculia bacterium]
MSRTARALTLTAMMFVASVVAASDAAITEDWQKKTRQSLELLKRGEYNASLKLSERVIRDMADHLGPGDRETRSFGIALTHKALALAGLQREDEARWYWHIALNLYPALAKFDLVPFGKPGEFLLAHTELRKPAEIPRLPYPPTANMTAPRPKKRVEPKYPLGARYFDVSGITIVEVLITRDGKVSSPHVLKALPAPTLMYATLDALRHWTFEPATSDGQPTDVVFNLTFNYKLR